MSLGPDESVSSSHNPTIIDAQKQELLLRSLPENWPSIIRSLESEIRVNDDLRRAVVLALGDLYEALGGPRAEEEVYMHQLGEAVQFLRSKIPELPKHAIVLGSGLGAFTERIENPQIISYSDIPHFPRPTVEGHAGELCIGKIGNETVATLSGRVHFYEGYDGKAVAFATRALGLLGLEHLVLTNAAGAIREDIQKGDIVIVNNHLNLSGKHPSHGLSHPDLGKRFCDMTHPYDHGLIALMERVAVDLKIRIRQGAYGIINGPSYETALEAMLLRRAEVDLAGMSSIFEAIAARQLGIKVLCISLATNPVAGRTVGTISHEEVTDTDDPVMRQARININLILAAMIPELGKLALTR